jgi:hypothetical protein
MAKKSTKDEVAARIHEVYGLFLRAYSPTQIVQYAAENWDVGERQAHSYMAEARQLLAFDAEQERPQWLQAAIARLLNYEKEAHERGNLSIAIKALEDQAKLLRFDMS